MIVSQGTMDRFRQTCTNVDALNEMMKRFEEFEATSNARIAAITATSTERFHLLQRVESALWDLSTPTLTTQGMMDEVAQLRQMVREGINKTLGLNG